MPSSANDINQFTFGFYGAFSENDYYIKTMYTFTRSETKINVLLEEERPFFRSNEGKSSVRKFTGSLPLEVFTVLSVQAKESNLMKLDSFYGMPVRGAQGTSIGIFWITNDEHQDQLQEYTLTISWNNEGPSNLATFESEIRALINQIDWEYTHINWNVVYGGSCLIVAFLMFAGVLICHTICCNFPKKEEITNESQQPMLKPKKVVV